jgi:hypothetical protein
MGYGRTPKTIERTKPLLDEMVNSDKTLEWIFDDPNKVAYKLWEAIRFAVKSKNPAFSQYTTLLNKYKIKVVEPDIVKAEIRGEPIFTPNGIIIRGVSDVLEIISIAIESKKKLMIFPDVETHKLSKPDGMILSNWCKSNSYRLLLDPDRLILQKE